MMILNKTYRTNFEKVICWSLKFGTLKFESSKSSVELFLIIDDFEMEIISNSLLRQTFKYFLDH